MQLRRITINGRAFVLPDPVTAERMLARIQAAASGPPAWVTIPVRDPHQPKVLITPSVDCILEVLEIPDEEPATEDWARFLPVDWPMDL